MFFQGIKSFSGTSRVGLPFVTTIAGSISRSV
jgi:hypothetical protein